jgi:hypothetical protein
MRSSLEVQTQNEDEQVRRVDVGAVERGDVVHGIEW